MLLSWEGQRRNSEMLLYMKSSRTKLECHFLVQLPAARVLLFVVLTLKVVFSVLNTDMQTWWFGKVQWCIWSSPLPLWEGLRVQSWWKSLVHVVCFFLPFWQPRIYLNIWGLEKTDELDLSRIALWEGKGPSWTGGPDVDEHTSCLSCNAEDTRYSPCGVEGNRAGNSTAC